MPERFRTLRPAVAAFAALVFTLAPEAVHAAVPIRAVLNGIELKFDAAPLIENDRTLVPVRSILEPLGATIAWDQESRMVTANLGDNEIKIVVGSTLAVVNGSLIVLDVPAKITSDRTYVPLRFVAENLGVRVGWDGDKRLISLEGRSTAVASRDSATTSRSGSRMVEIARQYVGVPYSWGGTSPETGFDCSGFMYFVARQVGVTLPRTSFEQFTAGIAVERGSLIAGDLVFFSTYAEGASHAGIYDGKGSFVHAGSEGKGVLITPLSNVYWSQRFIGARRIVR